MYSKVHAREVNSCSVLTRVPLLPFLILIIRFAKRGKTFQLLHTHAADSHYTTATPNQSGLYCYCTEVFSFSMDNLNINVIDFSVGEDQCAWAINVL